MRRRCCLSETVLAVRTLALLAAMSTLLILVLLADEV